MAWSVNRKIALAGALITGLATIIASVIGIQPWKEADPALDQIDRLLIAGTVRDATTNEAIGQAQVTLAGRTERHITDDSGNFRIQFRKGLSNARVRIHITKNGYLPLDQSVEPPVYNEIFQLKKDER